MKALENSADVLHSVMKLCDTGRQNQCETVAITSNLKEIKSLEILRTIASYSIPFCKSVKQQWRIRSMIIGKQQFQTTGFKIWGKLPTKYTYTIITSLHSCQIQPPFQWMKLHPFSGLGMTFCKTEETTELNTGI